MNTHKRLPPPYQRYEISPEGRVRSIPRTVDHFTNSDFTREIGGKYLTPLPKGGYRLKHSVNGTKRAFSVDAIFELIDGVENE